MSDSKSEYVPLVPVEAASSPTNSNTSQTHNVAPTAESHAAAAQENAEMVYDGPMLRSARLTARSGNDDDDDFAQGTMTTNGETVPVRISKNQFKNLIWFILCPCLLLCPSVCDDDDTDNWRMNPIEPKKGNPMVAFRLLCCPCLEPKSTSTTHFSGHAYQFEDENMMRSAAV